MSEFLNIFLQIFGFMRDTTILSFSVGDVSVSITFLELLCGSAIACIGIDVIHKIFEW